MKIDGSYVLKAPRERVWALLVDPEVIARVLPGCERLEPIEKDAYRAVIRVGIGAIKGTYTGTVRLKDQEPFDRYRMVVEGKGAPGFLRGEGVTTLEGREGETIVTCQGDVHVGGTIASVGQRMIQSTAKMLMGQFFAAMGAEAAAPPGEPPKQGFIRNLVRQISAPDLTPQPPSLPGKGETPPPASGEGRGRDHQEAAER